MEPITWVTAITIIGGIMAITFPAAALIADWIKSRRSSREDDENAENINNITNKITILETNLEILKNRVDDQEKSSLKDIEDVEKRMDREIDRLDTRFEKITDMLIKFLSNDRSE